MNGKTKSRKERLHFLHRLALWFFAVGTVSATITMLTAEPTDKDMAGCIFTVLVFAVLMLSFYIPELIKQLIVRAKR